MESSRSVAPMSARKSWRSSPTALVGSCGVVNACGLWAIRYGPLTLILKEFPWGPGVFSGEVGGTRLRARPLLVRLVRWRLRRGV